ncbi:hypothetical protein [Aureimonas endophytica]|nr:hypothetical protein [Aureimonas endophytica]
MLGYSYGPREARRFSPPLWRSQLSMIEDHLELGFRDLIELRFVAEFTKAGLGILAIRNCLEHARACVEDERPFSTRRFRTDGKTIFLESIPEAGEGELLDLRSRQFVFQRIVERSFKDLDIEDDAVTRWRPFKGKASIVIDPVRSFGQPIVAAHGVPTIVLADAARAEGSIDRVARLYEIEIDLVRDAVRFEESLIAA